ncbi:MAG: hypothetical protein WBM02_04705 [bacterium]
MQRHLSFYRSAADQSTRVAQPPEEAMKGGSKPFASSDFFCEIRPMRRKLDALAGTVVKENLTFCWIYAVKIFRPTVQLETGKMAAFTCFISLMIDSIH